MVGLFTPLCASDLKCFCEAEQDLSATTRFYSGKILTALLAIAISTAVPSDNTVSVIVRA